MQSHSKLTPASSNMFGMGGAPALKGLNPSWQVGLIRMPPTVNVITCPQVWGSGTPGSKRNASISSAASMNDMSPSQAESGFRGNIGESWSAPRASSGTWDELSGSPQKKEFSQLVRNQAHLLILLFIGNQGSQLAALAAPYSAETSCRCAGSCTLGTENGTLHLVFRTLTSPLNSTFSRTIVVRQKAVNFRHRGLIIASARTAGTLPLRTPIQVPTGPRVFPAKMAVMTLFKSPLWLTTSCPSVSGEWLLRMTRLMPSIANNIPQRKSPMSLILPLQFPRCGRLPRSSRVVHRTRVMRKRIIRRTIPVAQRVTPIWIMGMDTVPPKILRYIPLPLE